MKPCWTCVQVSHASDSGGTNQHPGSGLNKHCCPVIVRKALPDVIRLRANVNTMYPSDILSGRCRRKQGKTFVYEQDNIARLNKSEKTRMMHVEVVKGKEIRNDTIPQGMGRNSLLECVCVT